jgi:hypothetical protein
MVEAKNLPYKYAVTVYGRNMADIIGAATYSGW